MGGLVLEGPKVLETRSLPVPEPMFATVIMDTMEFRGFAMDGRLSVA